VEIYSGDGRVLPFSRSNEGGGAARLISSYGIISCSQHQRPGDLGDAVGMCPAIRTRQVGPHSCIGPIMRPGIRHPPPARHTAFRVARFRVPSVCPQYSAHPLAQADAVRRGHATFACGRVARRRRPSCTAETCGVENSGTGAGISPPDWRPATDRGRCAHSAPHGPTVQSR
jgi:hypothetical protein